MTAASAYQGQAGFATGSPLSRLPPPAHLLLTELILDTGYAQYPYNMQYGYSYPQAAAAYSAGNM